MLVNHGGRRDEAARRLGCDPGELLDLSTGVPPEPDPAGAARDLAELADGVSRYPDPEGEPARSELAAHLGVRSDELLLAAGAQALIEILFPAQGVKSVALREPHYGEVRRCAERSGVRVHACSGDEAWPDAGLRWVTDPDGFTGERVAPGSAARGVLDESYRPLAERRAGVRPGWIRIGSLTKCLSMPGLRIGYAIAAPEQLEALRHWLPPWPTSTLALELMRRRLPGWEHREALAEQGRQRLAALLGRAGWQVRQGSASFVLARPPAGASPDFDRARILVRSFPEWPALRGWLRVGIPPVEDWARLEAFLCP